MSGHYKGFGGGFSAGLHPRGHGGRFVSKGGGGRHPNPVGYSAGFATSRALRITGQVGVHTTKGALKLGSRAVVGTVKGSGHVAQRAYLSHRVRATHRQYISTSAMAYKSAAGYRNGHSKRIPRKTLKSIERSHAAYAQAVNRRAMANRKRRS